MGREDLLDMAVLDVDELIGEIHKVVKTVLRQNNGLTLFFHLYQDVVQTAYRLLVKIR